MKDISLDIKNLNFYYGDNKALDNINMKLHKNSVVALIGPSGCGKSTFLRCLNRMNDIIDSVKYEGEIWCDKRNILKDDDIMGIRKNIGMVFQKPNPFPKSIYENIIYAPKRSGVKNKSVLEKIVKESLIDVGLYEEVSKKLNSLAIDLSGGQQQRLCIARAIAARPKIILMDEPTSALDPVATEKIEKLILKLKKDYTVVIVTHDIGQAYRISDYTGFFLDGSLIEFNSTKEFFDRPVDKKTFNYINGIFS